MRDLLVLCYHALSPTWTATLSTTPERFGAQLRLLASRGYEGVTFTDAVEGRVPRRAVAVTFDDAFASVERLARPVLAELGWPATVFVPTDFPSERRPLAWAGTDHWLAGEDAHELEPMGWDELRGLRDSGWELGSHTCSHPRLTTLGDAELAAQLRSSRAACEAELGACPSIAYPYGDVDRRVVDAARAAGYRAGAALPARNHRSRPLEWPRVGVYQADDLSRFRLKASRAVRELRRGAWRR
jgi:peptidoglycan/xylan/chitin deacetylase (PgdA/CDA1 family)